MDLSASEIEALKGILAKHMGDICEDDYLDRIPRARAVDPVVVAMLDHQPYEIGASWACSCTNRGIYVSKTHVVFTHVRPIVEKAATQKIRDLLERAGMDLDVMMQSDKIFGKL